MISELIARLLAGDNEAADRAYGRSRPVSIPGAGGAIDLSPLVEAGEGWFRGNFSVYQERLITRLPAGEIVRFDRGGALRNTGPGTAVIIGTVQGDRHEGGVLMFNLAMELRGWRAYNLGVDLPVREYRAAIPGLRATALAISFVLSRNIRKRFQELEEIQDVPVFVGGRSIINYQSLARNHGLIPLPGPMGKSAEQFLVEYNRWCRQHSVER